VISSRRRWPWGRSGSPFLESVCRGMARPGKRSRLNGLLADKIIIGILGRGAAAAARGRGSGSLSGRKYAPRKSAVRGLINCLSATYRPANYNNHYSLAIQLNAPKCNLPDATGQPTPGAGVAASTGRRRRDGRRDGGLRVWWGGEKRGGEAGAAAAYFTLHMLHSRAALSRLSRAATTLHRA
jgi:hypothetical protein